MPLSADRKAEDALLATLARIELFELGGRGPAEPRRQMAGPGRGSASPTSRSLALLPIDQPAQIHSPNKSLEGKLNGSNYG